MRDHDIPPQEIWRPIRGYEDFYEASSLGRVRRTGYTRATGVAGYILKPTLHPKTGYYAICLSVRDRQRSFLLHRVIADAFLGPCPPGLEVNHKDRDKGNCAASNLEYLTRRQNQIHAYANGVRAAHGTQKPVAKLDDVSASEIRASPERVSVLADLYGVHVNTIYDIKAGRTWKHTEVEA